MSNNKNPELSSFHLIVITSSRSFTIGFYLIGPFQKHRVTVISGGIDQVVGVKVLTFHSPWEG